MVERPKKVNITTPKEMSKLKISILGEGGVGKSCIAERYTTGNFDSKYTPTIAVDYRNKIIPYKESIANVNLWDFSGHPEFFEVRNEFYKETNAIILVFDITIKKTLDGMDMWMREASKYGAKDCVVIVCGNKSDESNRRAVSDMDARQWAKSRDYGYWEVSALKGTNIEEMFLSIIDKCLQKIQSNSLSFQKSLLYSSFLKYQTKGKSHSTNTP